MTFATDHHFAIGADHLVQGKPNQDFALSGTEGTDAYAIVSDGCSSGGMTDVGSRLWALSTVSAIRDFRSAPAAGASTVIDEIGIRQRILIRGFQDTLGLTRDDLLATSLYALLGTASGTIHVEGDGVVAIVNYDGRVMLHRFDWNGSMPFYPVYRLDGLEAFTAAQGGSEAVALRHETWVRTAEGYEYTSAKTYPVSDGVRGITLPLDRSDMDGLAYVVLFSDGVTQVDGLDWTEAALNLLAFKNPNGAFAKRRMIRFLKAAQAQGRGSIDDIAFAVIRKEAATTL